MTLDKVNFNEVQKKPKRQDSTNIQTKKRNIKVTSKSKFI